MKTIAVAIEGVLTKDPSPADFASAPVNLDGTWLKNLIQANTFSVLVTGCQEEQAVKHWQRVNGIGGAVEFPERSNLLRPCTTARIEVLTRLAHQHRTNLIVIDAEPLVLKEMARHGILVLQPHFNSRRVEVGEDGHVPLRSTPKFWGS